jgi:dTDP-4-dehydrorhamnose 3,5-epimerase
MDGVKIFPLKRFPDDRGYFVELMRQDWNDLLGEDQLQQVNMSYSFPGIIRAWHRHHRGQVDYFIVIKGTMRICAYDEVSQELTEITSSDHKPQIVRMPGHYWHGTKNVGNTPSLLVYCVNQLYDYQEPDEERRPWNDPAIIDPTTGQPYNWNKPPHS